MQYGNPGQTWTEWLDTNIDRDEDTKLLALREYIVQITRRWLGACTYDAAWANKKFAKLGITERIEREVLYTLRVPVAATLDIGVYATNRTEATEKFLQRLEAAGSASVSQVARAGDPVFIHGPEDPDLTVVNPEVPTTVDGTLIVLREIILLGHIAGPKICEEEANRVLRSFGLADIPPRRTFMISRPVEAEMRTTVEAYDEESARRVAGWRWDNGRSGYEVVDPDPTDELTVTVAS